MKEFSEESLIKSIEALHKKILNEPKVPEETELIFHEDCVEITGGICMVLSYETFSMIMKHPDVKEIKMESLKELLESGEAKSVGCDWYISNKVGVWNIVNFQGTDAVSINLSKVINYELFTEHFYEMSYDHLVSFIENKWHVEKDRKFFDKYIVV